MEYRRVKKRGGISSVISILTICACLFGSSRLYAEMLALLPLADVTAGDNGINLALTREIGNRLEKHGLNLVPEAEILRFMADNRVRYSGYMDSFLIRKMHRDLGCDLICLGTVTERGDSNNPSLGLTLSVVDVDKATPIWACTRGLSLAECIRAMGIGEPQSLDDLKTLLFDDLLTELNCHIDKRADRPEQFYQIISLQLTPEHLQGGTEIGCRLKIRFLESSPNRIAVETGGKKIYLERSEKPDVYQGQWISPQADGLYSVGLVLEWKDRSIERISRIASYNVFNGPPLLILDVKKVLRLGELIAFRTHLVLLPRLAEPRSLDRWSLEIRNKEGVNVVHQEKEGNLPSRIIWEGTDPSKRKLDNGVYTICFTAWDVAGNHAEVRRMVALQSSPQPVIVSTVCRGEKNFLKIQPDGSSRIPLSDWMLNAKSSDGQSLVRTAGKDLPALIELPELIGEESIYCDLKVKDRLGNRFSLRSAEIEIKSQKAFMATQEQASVWVEDF